MIDGRNYTSNTRKVLKHLDKLKDIQDGKPVGPVMIHLALTNKCNLNCSYCCYGGRNKAEELTTYQAMNTIDQFAKLGTKGLEITGGGDPLLHPAVNEIVTYGKFKGMSIGLISNGLAYDKFHEWDKLDWIRLSSHVLNEGKEKQVELFSNAIKEAQSHPNLDVGSVHIYTGNDYFLMKVVKFMDEHKVPTRITPDLTKDPETIRKGMKHAKDLMENVWHSQYSFVSDFNMQFERNTQNCFQRLIKPYIHPNGVVYECPGASFSPENFCNVDDKYKVCSIDDIFKTYSDPKILETKSYGCKFCKYQPSNELINDIVTETKDNDFA
jgi:MoaA/NifB/PqqE/SkfB family radical SAM enzyme